MRFENNATNTLRLGSRALAVRYCPDSLPAELSFEGIQNFRWTYIIRRNHNILSHIEYDPTVSVPHWHSTPILKQDIKLGANFSLDLRLPRTLHKSRPLLQP